MIQLTIEQQFQIRSFNDRVQQMSPEQLRETLIILHEHTVIKDAAYRDLLKHQWGLGNDRTNGMD